MSTHFTPDDLPLLLGTCIVPAIMEYLGVQNAFTPRASMVCSATHRPACGI